MSKMEHWPALSKRSWLDMDVDTLNGYLSAHDINAKTHDKSTALMMAAAHSNIKVVQVLIDKGADLKAEDEDGWTAELIAPVYNDDLNVTKLLENSRLKKGWTILKAYPGTNVGV